MGQLRPQQCRLFLNLLLQNCLECTCPNMLMQAPLWTPEEVSESQKLNMSSWEGQAFLQDGTPTWGDGIPLGPREAGPKGSTTYL